MIFGNYLVISLLENRKNAYNFRALGEYRYMNYTDAIGRAKPSARISQKGKLLYTLIFFLSKKAAAGISR